MLRCKSVENRKPDHACEFEILDHGSNEENTFSDARRRPAEDEADAAAEIERLLRLNGSEDTDTSMRECR
jgi:hypothetical protein